MSTGYQTGHTWINQVVVAVVGSLCCCVDRRQGSGAAPDDVTVRRNDSAARGQSRIHAMRRTVICKFTRLYWTRVALCRSCPIDDHTTPAARVRCVGSSSRFELTSSLTCHLTPNRDAWHSGVAVYRVSYAAKTQRLLQPCPEKLSNAMVRRSYEA